MKGTFLIPLVGVLLSFAVTGCYTLTKVNFGNGTTTTVKVWTSHTGEQIDVPAGKFRTLPHTTGDLIVTTQSKERFRFSHISTVAVDDRFLVMRTSPLGPGYITLSVMLETNMQLYVVLPGKKAVDEKAEQPNGYPKAARKVGG